MKSSRKLLFSSVLATLLNLGLLALPTAAQVGQPVVASPAVATPPPVSEAPLPNTILKWDAELKNVSVNEGDEEGHLSFSFTNVSPDTVVISSVHPSCGCTSAPMPSQPWNIKPGESGTLPVTISIHSKSGTLFKYLTVTTDKGLKVLNFTVNIVPMKLPVLTEADRANNVKLAQADRQAVFHGDCALCHVKQGEGEYGEKLYQLDCAICHEGDHRATMVPDLHALKATTNLEFWRTWIAHGKVGTLMPAFSSQEGGPLNDVQIATLATYLDRVIPAKPNP